VRGASKWAEVSYYGLTITYKFSPLGPCFGGDPTPRFDEQKLEATCIPLKCTTANLS
jgi:hypothetical protein